MLFVKLRVFWTQHSFRPHRSLIGFSLACVSVVSHFGEGLIWTWDNINSARCGDFSIRALLPCGYTSKPEKLVRSCSETEILANLLVINVIWEHVHAIKLTFCCNGRTQTLRDRMRFLYRKSVCPPVSRRVPRAPFHKATITLLRFCAQRTWSTQQLRTN